LAERFRSIVREPEFEEELARLIPNEEEADDFLQAAELILAHDPEVGTHAEGTDVWLLPMAPVRDAEVYLYYTFDVEAVYFVAILNG
jgi:hypothetical protein